MKTITPERDFAFAAESFNLAGEALIQVQPAAPVAEDTRTIQMFDLPVITSRCPSWSPWDAVQHKEQIAPGVWSVSTAGHGGFYVAPELLKLAPAYLVADTNYSGGGWFEEDCDWALVVAAFPSLFKPRDCFFALATMTGPGDYLSERRGRYLASDLAGQLRARAALHDETKEARP